MSIRVTTLDEKIRETPLDDSLLSTKEYFVNMGPQHPSTHGVLRLVLQMDGETVREVIPVLGYVHRGIEKKGERLNYRQFVHMTDRLDYLSALANNWALSMAVEKAYRVERSHSDHSHDCCGITENTKSPPLVGRLWYGSWRFHGFPVRIP